MDSEKDGNEIGLNTWYWYSRSRWYFYYKLDYLIRSLIYKDEMQCVFYKSLLIEYTLHLGKAGVGGLVL